MMLGKILDSFYNNLVIFFQLAKMMFLATFFPASTDEDDELHLGDKELPFDFVTVSHYHRYLLEYLLE